MKRTAPSWATRPRYLRGSMSAFAKDDNGATAVEYGLITTLIAIFMFVAVKNVGTSISAKFLSIGNNMNS